MALNTVYTRNNTRFSERILEWCSSKGLTCQVQDKDEKSDDEIDGLVIFHEDHNYDQAALELRESFERKLKPIHKIDVNGTKQVSVSHFELWLERNGCKSLLMIGTDGVLNNANLELLLAKM